MKLPEPRAVSFSTLISDVEKGNVRIPQFQRAFVWTRQQSAKLLDSIIKGYPIGTFIFWRTRERLRDIRSIGGIELPKPREDEPISYVLDGQQRMTSLFVSMKALTLEMDEGVRDYGNMQVNLLAAEDEEIVHIGEVAEGDQDHILLSKLLEGDFQYLASFPPKQQENIRLYRQRFNSYQFSVIEAQEAPIEVATEIFTRLNIGGRALTVFEIMVAKTYDHERGFDLLEKVEALDERLRDSNFGEIPHITVLQAAAAALAQDVSRKSILRLDKNDVIDHWEAVENAILTAIEYLRDGFKIPASRLLPFPSLVVAFAYFFYKSGRERPDAEQRKRLRDFFWRASLGGRYSASADSRIGQDLKKMDDFIEGRAAAYEWAVDPSPDFIKEHGHFQTGRSFIKALLCLMAAKDPKSFNSGNRVRVHNDWLKQVNSRNYHHFFPRAYMKKKKPGVDDRRVNHIVNITLVDDYLNKRVIRAKAPSDYLAEIEAKAGDDVDFAAVLESHFIDLEKDGARKDDFNTFFDNRARALSDALREQIIPQDIDGKMAASVDDEEDVPEEGS